ncbi:MAG: M20/M25/M40 family metallo-hydrolase [Pseudomonadota bacterium]
MNIKDAINDYFEDHEVTLREELIRITTELVAARTVNPGKARAGDYKYLEVTGQETKAARIAARYLEAWGIPAEIKEAAPLRGNLVARMGRGKPELALGLHLDTVPPGDGWDSDPFTVFEKDGELYGRGVLDNLGPLASTMIGMKVLKEIGAPLNGTLTLVALAGEEFHEADEPDPGIEFMLGGGHVEADFAIIPDIGENMRHIDVAEKGRMLLTITTHGKQAHGSTPERGINAAHMMARCLASVEDLELPHAAHPVLGGPSKNLGILSSGSAANIVPSVATAEVDVRFVPGQTPEGIRDLVDAACQEAIARYVSDESPAKVDVAINSSIGPHEVDPDNTLVRAIQANGPGVLGFTPMPFGIGGGTFAKGFNLAGVTAVGFGPGDDEQFHVPNERVKVDELMKFARLIGMVAIDLVG